MQLGKNSDVERINPNFCRSADMLRNFRILQDSRKLYEFKKVLSYSKKPYKTSGNLRAF